MKKFLSFIILCFALLSFSGLCYAENIVEESPNMQIEINGKVSSYSNTPILVNGRTMLPLREVLINLGIKNDNDHITWNGEEQSVTVREGTNKVYLKLDDTTAYINDAPVTLSAAPVIYKEKTYIPVRFVSQSLGKEVAWDDTSKKVLIKDRADYQKVKEIVDKAYQSTRNSNKYKVSQKMNFLISLGNIAAGSKLDATYLLDLKNKIGYYNGKVESIVPNSASNLSVIIENYIDKNILHTKNPVTASWEKKTLPVEDIDKNLDLYYSLLTQDILYTGLSVESTSKEDEIVLSGKFCLDQMIKPTLASAKINDYTVEQARLRLVIDKNTNFIKELSAFVNGKTTSLNNNPNWSLEVVYKNSDFNGTFDIPNPTIAASKN